MHHDLKIDQCYFQSILDGRKRFAIRFNDDRGFQAGDTFTKHEISKRNGIETGRKVDGEITYVTNYFQREGYVVFGFKLSCDYKSNQVATMTQREEFERFWAVERKNYRPHLGEDELFKEIALTSWKAAKAQAVPKGFKIVPVEPTVDQFGGMARDIIQWMRFTESKDQHSGSLVKWLKDMGNEIPDWLYSEPEVNHLSKHVLSKGTIAAIIYKSMLDGVPEQNK